VRRTDADAVRHVDRFRHDDRLPPLVSRPTWKDTVPTLGWLNPLKLRPVLSLLSSFRRKSNLHLMLLSQGDAIEAHILKPVHSQPSEKQLRFPTQHGFQHQWCHNPLKKTGSGYSDPALATMPLEYFESPARIFLRKVEAKGPNCFWKLDIRLTAIAYGCGNAIGQRPRALQAIKLP